MKKKYFIIGGLVVVLLLLIWVIIDGTQNGSLEITTPESPNNAREINVTVTHPDGVTKDSFIMTTKATRSLSLKPGTYRIDASADNIKSVDVATIKSGQSAKVEIKFGSQQNTTKIGADVKFCPYLVDGIVYSYNCRGEGFIYRHPSADGAKIPVLSSTYFGYLKPYYSGFLGFPITNPNDTSRTGLVLSFMDMKTQAIQKVNLPASLPPNLNNNVSIITSSDPSKTYFALSVRDQSKIYLFKNLGDQNPAVITLPGNKKFVGEGNVLSLSFANDMLVAYLGKGVEGEHDDGEADSGSLENTPENTSTPKADGSIYEYDLTGKLTKTIGVPDDFWADTVTRLNGEYYAANNIRSADVYYLPQGSDKLQKVYSLEDATGALVFNNVLYMVVNQGVFSFTPQQNGQFSLANVYNSSQMRVSDIFASASAVIFTAYKNDVDDRGKTVDSPLDVYSLAP